MAWTMYQKFLAVMMVVTGSINTLATKWADDTYSDGKDGQSRKFNHPFLQATCMFLGEVLCLILFKILYTIYKRRQEKDNTPLPNLVAGNQNFSPIIFLAPAMCDMTATSLMYIGLNLTYASSFQMLRGAVIVFTGLLSVAFLNRKLKLHEWIGIFIVMIGLGCVGASDIVFPPSNVKHFDQNSILTGDELIIMAQVITATQMVIEEKFVGKHNVPALQGVGWEGLFGFVTLSLLLIPMYYIPVGHTLFTNPGGNLEDAIDGFYQMGNSWIVMLAITGTVLSIAFFNFAGLSVTKEMSATTRMVLDSVRTFVIWIISLLTRDQTFNYLQLIGFLVLSVGMCVYNDVIIRPLYYKIRGRNINNEDDPLLQPDEEPITKSGSINA